MARRREFSAEEARQRLPFAWQQYELARGRLSRATARYLQAKRLIRLLLAALGKEVPPGPWHAKGRGRGTKGEQPDAG